MQISEYQFTNLHLDNLDDYAAVGKAFFDKASAKTPGSVYGQAAIIALNFRLHDQLKDETHLSKFGYSLARDTDKILHSINKGIAAHRASGKGEPAETLEDLIAIIGLTPKIVLTDFLLAESFRLFPIELNNHILHHFFEVIQPLRLRLHAVNHDVEAKNKIAKEYDVIIRKGSDETPAVISEKIFQSYVGVFMLPHTIKLSYEKGVKVVEIFEEIARIGRSERSQI